MLNEILTCIASFEASKKLVHKWNEHLKHYPYINGYTISIADILAIKVVRSLQLRHHRMKDLEYLNRWREHIEYFIYNRHQKLLDTLPVPHEHAVLQRIQLLACPSLKGRRAGKEGGLLAQQMVSQWFQEIGIECIQGSQTYLQPFSFFNGGERIDTAGNILGWIPGTKQDENGPIVVITAHFDHLGEGATSNAVFAGADDNASGVSALMLIAEHLIKHRPQHDIIIIATDGEEAGFKGMKALLSSGVFSDPRLLNRVKLSINIDQISRGLLCASGPGHHPYLQPYLEQAETYCSYNVRYGHDGINVCDQGELDWTDLSDSVEFHKLGIPWVLFSCESTPDYHSIRDTYDRLEHQNYLYTLQFVVCATQILIRNVEVISQFVES